MGIYTAYNLPRVDEAIEAHMQALKVVCLSVLGSNLNSLILSGSFGRGEGSVILHADGLVEPLRDYDIRLIVRQPVPHIVLDRIRSEFMRVTGLGGARERFSGEQGFSLTLEALTEIQFATSFARDRDLRAYDHVNASRVIFGMDGSAALRFPAAEIPKINGLRFLYQKMVGLVGHSAGPTVSDDVRRTLLYECDKTFVEICTALVLLADAYVPSYRARSALFANHWCTWFPDLVQQLPALSDQVERATREKLYPGSTTPLSPLDAFAQARAALLTVHRFYVGRLYGIDMVPGQSGSAQLRTVLWRDYFRVAVTHWLRQRRLDRAPARWALNVLYHYRLRLKFSQGADCRGLAAIRESLRAAEAPPIDIFLAAWCALAAAGESPDEVLLLCSGQALDRLPGLAASRYAAASGWERYARVREWIAQAYAIWERDR